MLKIRARITDLVGRPAGAPGEMVHFIEVATIDNMGTGRLQVGPFSKLPPYIRHGAVVSLELTEDAPAAVNLAEQAEAPAPEPAEPKRRKAKKETDAP